MDTAARLVHPLARATLFGFLVVCLVLALESIKAPDAGNYVLWWIPYEMMIGMLFSLGLDTRMRAHDLHGMSST